MSGSQNRKGGDLGDDVGQGNSGPLTRSVIFYVKNCVLSVGNKEQSEAFKKGRGMTWSCSREMTLTEKEDRARKRTSVCLLIELRR